MSSGESFALEYDRILVRRAEFESRLGGSDGSVTKLKKPKIAFPCYIPIYHFSENDVPLFGVVAASADLCPMQIPPSVLSEPITAI